jgi:hypothetical protein
MSQIPNPKPQSPVHHHLCTKTTSPINLHYQKSKSKAQLPTPTAQKSINYRELLHSLTVGVTPTHLCLIHSPHHDGLNSRPQITTASVPLTPSIHLYLLQARPLLLNKAVHPRAPLLPCSRRRSLFHGSSLKHHRRRCLFVLLHWRRFSAQPPSLTCSSVAGDPICAEPMTAIQAILN